MDFYKKNITCNLSNNKIRELVDFDIIFGIKSKNVLNKNELLKITTCKKLNISNNQIEEIANIPEQIEVLDCKFNSLKALSELPENLFYLYCQNNEITSLDNLNQKLTHLNCSSNKLVRLENLPFELIFLIVPQINW